MAPPAGVFGEGISFGGVIVGNNKLLSGKVAEHNNGGGEKMKRAFVFLLAVFMMVWVISSAFAAESDLSPFHGLRFNEPDTSIISGIDFDLSRETSITGYPGFLHSLIGWGFFVSDRSDIYNVKTYYPWFISLQHNDYPMVSGYYDSMKVGEQGCVEKGPIESLAGLPAFYEIRETFLTGLHRMIIWYISCEDSHFMVALQFYGYDDPSNQPFQESGKLIFEDFLKNLVATDELKPGNLGDGGNGGGNPGFSGDDSSGGCDVSGGLFSILSLAVFFVLRRNKI